MSISAEWRAGDPKPRGRPGFLDFATLFGSAVTSQALLSGTSLVVGLVLIRLTTDLQYGYYILATSALVLLTALQNAFLKPPLAIRMTRLDRAGRSDLVGGLYRGQARIATAGAGVASIAAVFLWLIGVLDVRTGPLTLVTIGTAIAVLHREYFRMVLFVHRHPLDVLRSDTGYAILLVAGVALAAFTPAPATVAVLTLGLASVAGGLLLARALRRFETWNRLGTPGIMREIAPLAAWSTAGAAIHWSFSQGYTWLVAGTLDITAVAAVAATRLTVMPVNMLSSGIGLLMLPMVSRWLQDRGPALVLGRLARIASAIAVASLCYFAVLWMLREWIFTTILHKHFVQRDQLLMLWCATAIIMVVRDQLIYFVAARSRFRPLAILTGISAVLALATSYWGIRRFGAAAAPTGVLVGELINFAGIVLLSYHEARDRFAAPALATAGP